MRTVIEAADLFCGAGGTSTGMLQAGNDLGIGINLLAVNLAKAHAMAVLKELA